MCLLFYDMSHPLKIAIIPYDIAWGDKDENLLSIGEKLGRVESDTDIVVLPEMFTTGVLNDPAMVANLAETNQDRTMMALCRLASFFNFAICGSFLATTSGNYYNRAFFVEPSGEVTYYDKKHLFTVGGEDALFSAGDQQSEIIRYRGWNISLAVCYDLRFPVWNRNVNNRYDIKIFVANWPSSRSYAWQHLLIARAIENQSYVVGANRVGGDDYGTYSIDDSMCIDYLGKIISEKSADNILYSVADYEKLMSFRRKFPVWKDADVFSLD